MPPFRHLLLDRDVGWVVILGAGSRENQLLTPEDALDEAGLKRVMEGVRLARLLPGAKLVFTGGSFERGVPIAFAMSRVALDFGMDKARIVPRYRPPSIPATRRLLCETGWEGPLSIW